MSVVHSSQGRLKPISKNLRSEVNIVCEIAERVFKYAENKSSTSNIQWSELKKNYSLIRDSIAQVITGFENFNQKITKPQGFTLPNRVRDHREFPTEDGKARFTVHAISSGAYGWNRSLSGSHHFNKIYTLMTIRSHDQYNTTVYGFDDRYRGISGSRNVILINSEDAKDQQLDPGTFVDITSHFRGKERTLKAFRIVYYEIPKGCLAAYFPEANPLVPIHQTAERSNTPASKSLRVSLKRHESKE